MTALAAAVTQVAREVSAVQRTLEGIGRSDGSWRGEAASEFAGTLGELPPYLAKATAANEKTTGALDRWAQDLTAFQVRAADYERQAEAAKARLDAARQTLGQYASVSPGADPVAAERLRQQVVAAQRAVTAADSALGEIVAQARQLAGLHEAALRATAARIREAADAAPPEPGFWDRLTDAVAGVGEWVASLPEQIGRWIEENKYLIKAIGDFLSDLSLVVGTVSMFLPPPANMIGLGIAGALGLGAMAAHGVAWAAGAEGINALTLVTDGVSVLGSGFGIIGKLGTRGAAEAIRIGAATSRGGMVASGQSAYAYYTSIDNASTVGGAVGTVTGWGNNAVADGTLRPSDVPFSQWVPRSGPQAAMAAVTGPAGVAFVNYVSDASRADAAANAQAERDRWIR